MKKIFVINGPNLDMLGVREPNIYGKTTLADIRKQTEKVAEEEGYAVEFSQYNGEGEIVEALHRAYTEAAAVIINAAAYTHYSYAIADGVKMLSCPVVELHISNVFAREDFRRLCDFALRVCRDMRRGRVRILACRSRGGAQTQKCVKA